MRDRSGGAGLPARRGRPRRRARRTVRGACLSGPARRPPRTDGSCRAAQRTQQEAPPQSGGPSASARPCSCTRRSAAADARPQLLTLTPTLTLPLATPAGDGGPGAAQGAGERVPHQGHHRAAHRARRGRARGRGRDRGEDARAGPALTAAGEGCCLAARPWVAHPSAPGWMLARARPGCVSRSCSGPAGARLCVAHPTVPVAELFARSALLGAAWARRAGPTQ